MKLGNGYHSDLKRYPGGSDALKSETKLLSGLKGKKNFQRLIETQWRKMTNSYSYLPLTVAVDCN